MYVEVLLPEFVLAIGTLVILLTVVFFRDLVVHVRHMVLALLLCVMVSLVYTQSIAYSVLWEGMFVHDSVSYYVKGVLLSGMFFIAYFSKSFVEYSLVPKLELYSVLLFQLLGMFLVVSAKHMMTIFIGIELMYLPMYALVALPKRDKLSLEAAVKYMVMGGLASALMLYGFSLLYAVTGHLALDNIQQFLLELVNNQGVGAIFTSFATNTLLLTLAVICVLAAMAFKFGTGPFYVWVPDVYQGSSTLIVALVSSLPKLVLCVVWLRLFSKALGPLIALWQGPAIVLGAIAMFIGSVFGLVQTNIRRILAYSAVAHMGFILIGLSINDATMLHATFVYCLGYVLASLVIFLLLSQYRYFGKELANLTELYGMWQLYPLWACVLLIAVFSLLGMPPLVGFMLKFYWLFALIQQGYMPLALFAVLMSMVGCYYYLRFAQAMFFEPLALDHAITLDTDYIMGSVVVCFGAVLVLFGVYPNFLMHFVHVMLKSV